MSQRRRNASGQSSSSFSYKKGNSSSSTINLVGGFPDRQRVTLRYVTNVSQTANATVGSDYVFRANGCFDPDYTSTGGQPANYDDFSAIYLRYRVWGSTLRWSIANTAGGTLDMSSVVVGPRHQGTAIVSRTNTENFQAQPYTRFQKTIIYNNGTESQSGSMHMTTRQFLGLTSSEFEGADDLASLVSNTPAHEWFWHCTISMDDQSSTCVHYVNYVVEYDVEFFDRVDTTIDSRLERVQELRRAFASTCMEKKMKSLELKVQEDKKDKDDEGATVSGLRIKIPPVQDATPRGYIHVDNPVLIGGVPSARLRRV